MITADLSHKVAIVTGGASGIGLAVSKLLLHAGAKLIMNDISIEAPDIRADLGAESPSSSSMDNMRYVAADIADPSTPGILVDAAKTCFGRLDILINNAATAGGKAPIPFECLEKLDDEFWTHLLDVNLVSPFRMAKAAAPELRKTRGIVINTASVAGLTGQASSIPYAASKAGLINLTQNLARALAPDIRVNAVAPGWIDTPWTKSWPPDRRQRSIEKTLLKRLGTAEDIAETMLFLAAGGKYITGQTIVVDGGR